MEKIKNLLFVSLLLLVASFSLTTRVDAYYNSVMVDIQSPKNGDVIPEGSFTIDLVVPHVYSGVLDGKVNTRLYWETTKDGKRVDGGYIIYRNEYILEMYKAGDWYSDKMLFNTVGGGKYTFTMIAVPFNADTHQIDSRISDSSWPGKSITFYVYEDKNPNLSFKENKITKNVGDEEFKNYISSNSAGKISYKSSNTDVATVDKNGMVKVKGKGTATITATQERTYLYKEARVSYEVTVKGNSSDNKTTTTSKETTTTTRKSTTTSKETTTTTRKKTTKKTTSRVKENATLKFEASVVEKSTKDGDFTNKLTKITDGAVSFKSSDTSVATVDSKGKVTIKGVGTTYITAKTKETVGYKAGEASYKLIVSKEVTTTKKTTTTTIKKTNTTKKTTTTKKVITALSAKFKYGDATLKVGQKFTNELIPSESGGTITYKSTDKSIASVDSSTGEVTPLKVGSCRIAGTFTKNGNSVTVYYNITVKKQTTTTTKSTTTTKKGVSVPVFTVQSKGTTTKASTQTAPKLKF